MSKGTSLLLIGARGLIRTPESAKDRHTEYPLAGADRVLGGGEKKTKFAHG